MEETSTSTSEALHLATAVIQTLQQRLDGIDQATQVLESFSSLDSVESQLSKHEAAKFDVALAYSLATLYFVEMNIQGKDTKNHPIQEILRRIKGYVAQVNAREPSTQQPAESTSPALTEDGKRKQESSSSTKGRARGGSKKVKIDAAVANRIVRHNLSS
eukprot:gene1289-1409_t